MNLLSSITILLFSTLSLTFHVQTSEADYADLIQIKLGGEREATVPSGRVDLLTDTHAYEVEWANKWKESVGQALWYGLQTRKQPGIILIMRKSTDFKYVQQLNSALLYAKLDNAIDVKVWPIDFE